GDRPYYTAPAISPNGTDVYITYNAFTTPYRNDTSSPRGLVGVILHADVTGGSIGTFGTQARGAGGDPRASSQNDLTAESLGDHLGPLPGRKGKTSAAWATPPAHGTQPRAELAVASTVTARMHGPEKTNYPSARNSGENWHAEPGDLHATTDAAKPRCQPRR